MKTEDRYKKALDATWITITGNFLLSAGKLIAGVAGGSSALVMDAIHSASDMISSVIVIYGLSKASKPRDEDHPYGHGKAESLAGQVTAFILIIFALGFAWRYFQALFNPERIVKPKTVTLWIAVISYVAKEAMFRYKFRIARKLKSSALLADAWDHRTDAFSSLVVIAGIGISIFGGKQLLIADKLAAIIIALIVVVAGTGIFRTAARELMDAMPPAEFIDRVRGVAMKVPRVLGIEKIFARKSGLSYLVDIHVEVDGNKTVTEGHEITCAVKEAIIRDIPEVLQVLVHIEPFYPGDH